MNRMYLFLMNQTRYKMKELLESANLTELYENLDKFAKYNRHQCAVEIFNSFKKKVKESNKVRQGGREQYYEGYDEAIKEVLSFLRGKTLE